MNKNRHTVDQIIAKRAEFRSLFQELIRFLIPSVKPQGVLKKSV